MNPRVKELFHELADLPIQVRMRYFAEHGVDDETRREVEDLLTFDPSASGFLLDGVSLAASRTLSQLERQVWRCGPYRLLDVIGRGGMGAVYLAERVDGEVTQRLAVKLLPAGAGDNQRERFLKERQILASLSHPNIARMLDAGHVDNRQPFLAMEYVDGKPIDVFVAGSSVRQKISLFLKVREAIAYLHRNLVVHCDLKPSNILVSADGEPKLLDFGIAKMLDLATDSTMTSMRMLTPDYASPEQVTGGRVTTGTDIYSLGAVLYQLLTGKLVHEFDDHSPEAIAKVVTTREVTRPSRLAPELKGDIEFILLKALRKDPGERYGAVEQLAGDLEAFLESRPVTARSGNAWYRTRKFLRRYWIPVTAAAIVIASLATGLYIANRERNIANRERAVAEQRFQDVRQLANKLFDIDQQVRQLPGSTTTRQLIVDTSLAYLQRLRSDVQGDPELALEVANAYMRVARVEGVPGIGNLGQTDKAQRDLGIAEELIDTVLRLEPANRTALLRASQAAADRMVLAFFDGRSDEELASARKSAGWLERFNAGSGDRTEAMEILSIYASIGYHFVLVGQLDEALQICNRGSDLARVLGSPISFLSISAQVFRYRGDLDEALKQIQEFARQLDPGRGEGGFDKTMSFVHALTAEGEILGEDDDVSLGRTNEAVATLERAFKIADGLVHKDLNDQSSRDFLSYAATSLADILRHTNAGAALAVYDHALRHLAEINNTHKQDVFLLAGSSYALRRLGRPAEARQRLDAASARLVQLKLYPAEKIRTGSEQERVLWALADHEADTGDAARGIELYQGLLDRLEADGAKPETSLHDALDLSHIWRSMGAICRRAGKFDLVSSLYARRRALWQQWDRKLPKNPFVLRQIAEAASP